MVSKVQFVIFILLAHIECTVNLNDQSAVRVEPENGPAPISLPSKFHQYDLDGNGAVTVQEVAKVTGTNRKDANLPFNAADENGDNIITPDEFQQAPWLLDYSHVLSNAQMKPDTSDSTILTNSTRTNVLRKNRGRKSRRKGWKRKNRRQRGKGKRKPNDKTKPKAGLAKAVNVH